METRPRTRHLLRGAAILAALGALTAPATAGAAVKAPVITNVTPKSVSVGGTLIIRGKYFRRGKGHNRVLFRGSNGKSLFVRSGLSTAKRMTVVVPSKLGRLLAQRNGVAVATRFRLRVLTSRMSKRYTATKNSPLVAPALKPTTSTPTTSTPTTSTPTTSTPTSSTPPGDGHASTPAPPPACPVGTDDDHDGLSSAFERSIGTNPCAADSDGDGITDGYEYGSAVDLNQDSYRAPTKALPYPGKRPYPNPLDPGDADTDFDGDGLTMSQEFTLWRYTVAHGADPSLENLTYSDGLKYSEDLPAGTYDKEREFKQWLADSGYDQVNWGGVTSSVLDTNRDGTVETVAQPGQLRAEDDYLDTHDASGDITRQDGRLSDDERDEDADGLSNWVELNGPMLPDWYAGVYKDEKPYTIDYAGTSPVDPDSDGDGVRDGADDQDHDDVPNFDEVSRNMVSALPLTTTATAGDPNGFVNPYNPCLPFVDSRTCPTYLPLGGTAWAPFNDDGTIATSYIVRY